MEGTKGRKQKLSSRLSAVIVNEYFQDELRKLQKLPK